MPRVEVLSHTVHLKRVGFGRPHPRHGLHLLHWFCTQCLYIDRNGQMVPHCDPDNEDFGFHLFENRFDQNYGQLLPDINFQYYVVGNLNSNGAEQLPDYVREEYTGLYDNSNKDRIIVSLKCGRFDKVYVTEHHDEWSYDPQKTFRVHIKLIKYIRRKERGNFLGEMGVRYTETCPVTDPPPPTYKNETHITINNCDQPSSIQQQPGSSLRRRFWDHCVIL